MKKWLILLMMLIYPCILSGQEKIIRFTDDIMKLADAMLLIEQQSSYTIAFNHNDLDINKIIRFSEKTFTLEEALDYLLSDIDCTYRVEHRHIIIYKKGNVAENKTGYSLVKREEVNLNKEYSGKVYESKSRSPLSYATITILDENKQLLIAGVTDHDGEFHINSKSNASFLRISFVGFKTKEYPLTEGKRELGEFYLEENQAMLDEVTVTASAVQYEVDRNTYIITDEMRNKSSNAQDLLDEIHGLRFDKVSNTIKVGNQSNVLLLVDGMQQSQEYIKNISPDRIRQIEVVKAPSGRYVSEGYNAIINFILKKDYTGYDIFFHNFAILSPFGNNGDNWLTNEQPYLGFTYTKKKINVYGTFAYGRSRWNTPIEREVDYKNGIALESEKLTTDDPNDIYRYSGSYVTLGMNYNINENHIFSAQAEYSYYDAGNENLIWMKYVGNDMPDYDTGDKTINKTRYNDIIGTVFYKGKLSDKLNIYSDLSYNYYYNSIYNEYISMYRSPNDVYEKSYNLNRYKENKKLTAFNSELNYSISPKTHLDAGYSLVWRKYDSKSREGEQFLDYTEMRNRFYLYLSIEPHEKWKIKFGTAIENIDVKDKDVHRNEWSLQPYLQLNYAPVEKVNVNAAYITNIYYPSLYQLSPMHTAIDTFLIQVGNPELKSAVRHTASIRLTLWDRLSFIPIFKYTPKRISEIYNKEGQDYIRSFANIDVKQYNFQILYDQPIGKYITLNSMFMYHYNTAEYDNIKNSIRGWLADIDIEYYHPGHALGVGLGYYRGLEKSIMLQGYQMINMDNWVLSMKKSWLDNRLSFSVNYILPLSWGVRKEQKKEVNTAFFYELTNQDLSVYNNMILTRLTFRFDSGKVNRTGKKSSIEREERERRTIGF